MVLAGVSVCIFVCNYLFGSVFEAETAKQTPLLGAISKCMGEICFKRSYQIFSGMQLFSLCSSLILLLMEMCTSNHLSSLPSSITDGIQPRNKETGPIEEGLLENKCDTEDKVCLIVDEGDKVMDESLVFDNHAMAPETILFIAPSEEIKDSAELSMKPNVIDTPTSCILASRMMKSNTIDGS